MKPKDIFCLAVRFLGLVFLYHGLVAIPSVFSVVTTSLPGGELRNILFCLIIGAWPLVEAHLYEVVAYGCRTR
ncbi:MAG TPA: hypothetical protein VFA77_07435 [Candidatus Eisenbacteria bacterium]|nr:hypothetical protein [Candidatus Eisenbacteria bacterium]